ncbi:UNKNOWN [Stylonychia lemnae]|uniref:Uncharacterized protein n=1 Tax=Stylonychia lemnae TaxID=5949 RepID=A0A078A867_STYLE|nr:UNKNOWN [Stylonychia lemnae]|eukprot:CDW78450.1 UNKNOWN [Stylonychia lemnae]
MNFGLQHNENYSSNVELNSTPFNIQQIQYPNYNNNENYQWHQPAVPMTQRYLPTAQSTRQFGKQLQNIPNIRETVHQADQMEVDEVPHYRKSARQTQSFVTRQKTRSNRRSDSNRCGTTRNSNNPVLSKNQPQLLRSYSQVHYDYQCDRDTASNTQFCSEYAGHIHQYLLRLDKLEQVDANYMGRQTEINDKMRAILVDWLIEVHLKFKLQKETLFITIKIIDRFLEKEIVTKSRLQLVGVTALLIASKYEEIYPPELKDFVFITDKAYTKEHLLAMEFNILSVLSFDITFPTANRFLERYIKLLGNDHDIWSYAQFFIELALIDIRMLQYDSSVVAASAICLAYKDLSLAMSCVQASPQYDQRVEQYISQSLGFNETDLLICIKELQFIKIRSTNSTLQSVRKKYAHPQYSSIHPYIFQQS